MLYAKATSWKNLRKKIIKNDVGGGHTLPLNSNRAVLNEFQSFGIFLKRFISIQKFRVRFTGFQVL